MNRNFIISTLAATLALSFSSAGIAGPREDQLDKYASAAKAANPAFSGFSAARGKTLHTQAFAGGKPDTPACTSCHGKDTRASGRTPAGKTIEADGAVGLAVALHRPGQSRKVVQAQLQRSARARMHAAGKG